MGSKKSGFLVSRLISDRSMGPLNCTIVELIFFQIFIGGVPRPTKASELAFVLESHYGSVCYAGIDVDPEMKYPKGAARVTFNTFKSYVAAMAGRFVNIPHSDSTKRVC